MKFQYRLVQEIETDLSRLALPGEALFKTLAELARPLYESRRDAAHDIGHAMRVANIARKIALKEGGDNEVIIAAAIFHDVVIYPKDDPRSSRAPEESASVARQVLSRAGALSNERVLDKVCEIIQVCSDTVKGEVTNWEGIIVKDADLLEKTGAIAIARTFWSAGEMGHPIDAPSGEVSAMEYLRSKLRSIQSRLRTGTAKDLAIERAAFLEAFLYQINKEIGGVMEAAQPCSPSRVASSPAF